MTRLLPAPIFKSHLLAKVYSGDKSQTRRIVKIQPPSDGYQLAVCVSTTGKKSNEGKGHWVKTGPEPYMVDASDDRYIGLPNGKPGDFWYFREGLAAFGNVLVANVQYRLDGEVSGHQYIWKRDTLPSIHMPRDCARRFARVTSVRVERVQDINTTDCWAEGIPSSIDVDPRHEFADLWDSINAKRGFSWGSNPFVWCYQWELVERDAIPAEAWVK